MVEPLVVLHLVRQLRRLGFRAVDRRADVNRCTVSDKHPEVCDSLEIQDYQLRDSLHTFAVWTMRTGASLEAIAQQLGHPDTSMAVRVYGRFKPTLDELMG